MKIKTALLAAQIILGFSAGMDLGLWLGITCLVPSYVVSGLSISVIMLIELVKRLK